MTSRHILMIGLGLGLGLSACSGSSSDGTTGSDTAGTTTGPAAGTTSGATGGTTTGAPSYIGLAIRVNTPAGRTLYLNAFPSMPTDTLDLTQPSWLQFQSSDYSFAYGDAFVWDRTSTTYTQYSLDATGTLQQGTAMSLAALGVSGIRHPFFISPTLAYDYGAGATLISWNPSTMSIVDHVTAPALGNLPPGGDPDAGFTLAGIFPAQLIANDMAIPIYWDSSDRSQWDNNVELAMVDTTNLHADVSILQDSRCSGATSSFVDENGDLYVTGTAANGSFQLFPPAGMTVKDACMLRIKKGTTTFDSFDLDLLTATGDRAIYQTYYAGKGKLLVIALSNSYTVTTLADFQSNPQWEAFIVDLASGTATKDTNLPTTGVFNNTPYVINGQLYFQNYNTVGNGTSTSTSVTLYAVDSDGSVSQDFTVTGDVWGMGAMSKSTP